MSCQLKFRKLRSYFAVWPVLLVIMLNAAAVRAEETGGSRSDDPGLNSSTETCFFTENWEFGVGSWTADALWSVGTPNFPGLTGAYEGLKCAGTSFNSTYPATSSGRLASESIQLPAINAAAGEKITMRIVQWFSTYDWHDFGRVEINTGSGWVPISGNHINQSIVWSPEIFDLSAYAGSSIRIGFYFASVPYGEDRGWYIDSITICKGTTTAPVVPIDFEAGDGGWSATNGLWEVGTPGAGPQSAYRGNKCACTNLNGNYPPTQNTMFVSPEIKLPAVGASESLTLKYASWFNTYDSADSLRVLLSVNNGPWRPVGDRKSGSSDRWTVDGIPISAYADSTIRIAFRLVAHPYGEAYGWCIDHIYVEGANLVVVDTDPLPGTPQPGTTTSTIRVSLSNPLNQSTVNAGTFSAVGSVSGLLSGGVTFSGDGRSFIFTPAQSLVNNEIVTVHLTDDIFDVNGQALDGNGDWVPGGDFEWSFKVALPFQAISKSPAAGATGISPLDPIVVHFSRPVKPSTVTSSTWTVKDHTGATIVGEPIMVSADSLTATFVPKRGTDHYFLFGETVTSCLTASIKAPATPTDEPIVPVCWSFTVDDSSLFAIMGRVSYYADQNRSVPGVTLTLNPGAVVRTSDSGGNYAFLQLGPNNYTVDPARSGGLGTALQALDASLAARAALGMITLSALADSAADVSGNGHVTAFDAALIARRKAGIITAWPAPRHDWIFSPSRRTYSPLTLGKVHEDFLGILAGDVSGDWTASPQAPDLFPRDLTPPETVRLDANRSLAIFNELLEPAWAFNFSMETSLSGEQVRRMIELTDPQGWAVVVGNPEAGIVNVVAYGTSSLSPGSALARLVFPPEAGETGDGTVARITSFYVNDSPRPERIIVDDRAPGSRPAFALHPPQPNPVGSQSDHVKISFVLPEPGRSVLSIFSITGALIDEQRIEMRSSGENEIEYPIGRLANGIYLYRLQSGPYSATRKLVVYR